MQNCSYFKIWEYNTQIPKKTLKCLPKNRCIHSFGGVVNRCFEGSTTGRIRETGFFKKETSLKEWAFVFSKVLCIVRKVIFSILYLLWGNYYIPTKSVSSVKDKAVNKRSIVNILIVWTYFFFYYMERKWKKMAFFWGLPAVLILKFDLA